MIQSIWHLIKYSYITLFTYKHGDKAFWFSFIAKTFWQIYSFLSPFLLHQSLKPLPQQFDYVFLTAVMLLSGTANYKSSHSQQGLQNWVYFWKLAFCTLSCWAFSRKKVKNPNNKQAQTLTSTFSVCSCVLLSYRGW